MSFAQKTPTPAASTARPHHWLQVILAGGCFSLAFAPLSWRWAVVPALLLLLHALRGQSPKAGARLGFVFGFSAYACTLTWLWQVFGAFSLALFAILALFTGVFGWLHGIVESRIASFGKRNLAIAASWLACEYIRSEHFWLEFSWATPGLAMGPHQMLQIIGVYGASFGVVLGTAFLQKSSTVYGGIVILSPFLYGVWVTQSQKPAAPRSPVKVMLVQNESSDFEEHLAASQKAEADVQLVVWPEISASRDPRRVPDQWARLKEEAQHHQRTFTLGTYTPSPDEQGWYNTALTLDATGALGTHVKHHLVHFFNEGIPGQSFVPIPTALGQIGTSICFDNDFEDVPRRMTLAGAEFFAVPSMDPARWGARQHEQHSELVRIRAAENYRWFAVASSSGVTQIVDPKGRIVSRLPPLTEGTLTGIVGREQYLTFYTRWGWLFPGAVTGALAIWLVAPFFRRRS